jgi:hypothetical protein
VLEVSKKIRTPAEEADFFRGRLYWRLNASPKEPKGTFGSLGDAFNLNTISETYPTIGDLDNQQISLL